jgi:hypothetical protein
MRIHSLTFKAISDPVVAVVGPGCAFGRRCAAGASLAAILALSGIAGAAEPGILFRHGDAIRDVQVGRDLALGTQAAWTPAHDALVFATAGQAKRLVMRSWRNGAEEDRVLPVPIVQTELELQWQWSFSPDGRWLAVRRHAHGRRHLFAHEGTAAARQEVDRVKWIGVIDLASSQARAWRQWGEILGWRDGRCLLQETQYGPIIAVDPADPASSEKLTDKSGFVSGIANDGKWIVIYDGTNGNVRVTLQELGGKRSRVLLEDSAHRTGSYAKGGAAGGTFSPDGAWIAISTHVYKNNGWTTSVALESLDGQRRLYEDAFDIAETDDEARTIWAAQHPGRFSYFRFRKGRRDGELVVVDVKDGKTSAASIALKVKPTERLFFRPVSSPSGDRIAWLGLRRGVVIGNLTTGTTSVAGQLPDDATSWSWASPQVGGKSVLR